MGVNFEQLLEYIAKVRNRLIDAADEELEDLYVEADGLLRAAGKLPPLEHGDELLGAEDRAFVRNAQRNLGIDS